MGEVDGRPVTASTPTIVLADDFSKGLKDHFATVLPSGATVVHGLESDGAATADYIVTWTPDIGSKTVANFGNLKGVVKLDSGPATVGDESAQNILIGVASSPALVSVAEHAVMLILAAFKRLGPALVQTQAQDWAEGIAPMLTNQDEYSYNWVGLSKFEAVVGKTVGLVGLGRIGLEVASRLNAFGCDVVYTKRTRLTTDEEEALGVRYLPFDELLAASHCVSLHNRFTDETEKMMDEAAFALMPPGSVFVNTARGRLVDEDALIAALKSGHLAGAALDVAWYEPPLPESPLWAAPNVMLTPHSAGIPIDVSLEEELAGAAMIILEHWNAAS